MRRGIFANRAWPILAAACAVALAAVALARPADAQTSDESLRLYGVGIWHTPHQDWGPGGGVYLGNGYVLTAAHVAGHTFFTRPTVAMAGVELPAAAVREGALAATDLTLLHVAPEALPLAMRMRRMALCAQIPPPGAPVLVAVRGNLIATQIVSPAVLPPGTERFSTLVGNPERTATSGSGVFDAARKCLLGIVSRKISRAMPGPPGSPRPGQMRDVAVYFVPAGEIAQFLPPEAKF